MPKQIHIKDIQTAVEMFYTHPELETGDIMSLFDCSSSKAVQLKKAAQELQREKGILTFSDRSVNTKCAYEAWHIDIADLEKRFLRFQKIQKGVTT